METITKAWKARQEQVRSARIVWTERETVPKGQVSNFRSSLPKAKERLEKLGNPPGTVVPPEDTTYDVHATLSVDGGKFRYERQDRQWSAEKQAFVPLPKVIVFDGKVSKTFRKKGSTDIDRPTGNVRKDNPEQRTLKLFHLMLLFRPFDPQLAPFDVGTLTMTGRRTGIDGKSYLILERRQGEFTQQVWVDPLRDYLPVRIVTLMGEQTRARVDIGYRKDTSIGWVPERWDIATSESAVNARPSRARLVEFQANQPIAATDFDIEFPPGTRVSDINHPGSPLGYIVREDGSKRSVLKEELGATYDQMVKSNPGEALGKHGSSFFSWPVILGVVLLISSGGLLTWRVFRSRQRAA